MSQLGLFDAQYPSSPGYKRAGTSSAAAEVVKPRVATLREQVLALLKLAPLTADECAARLDKSILSIRPRLSELVARNLIEETGSTRRNESGIQATVWRAV